LVELTAALHPVYFAGYAALARELTAAFARQGFRIKAEKTSMDEWLDTTSRGAADLCFGRWGADFPDPDSFAYLLHSEAGILGRLCSSAAVDRLIERARGEPAAAARHKIYRELEDLLARDAMMLPLFHEQVYRFARPEVEGLSVSFGNPAVAYEELRIRG
jgi:peptide/nickel transport system substrate-binding protein